MGTPGGVDDAGEAPGGTDRAGGDSCIATEGVGVMDVASGGGAAMVRVVPGGCAAAGGGMLLGPGMNAAGGTSPGGEVPTEGAPMSGGRGAEGTPGGGLVIAVTGGTVGEGSKPEAAGGGVPARG